MLKRSLASRGGMPGTMGPLRCKKENFLLHLVLSHLFVLPTPKGKDAWEVGEDGFLRFLNFANKLACSTILNMIKKKHVVDGLVLSLSGMLERMTE